MSDGVQEPTRTVTLSSDTVFTALFHPSTFDECDTISEFPYQFTWDPSFTCWEQYTLDEEGWTLINDILSSSNMMSAGTMGNAVDNWIITKLIYVNTDIYFQDRIIAAR